jgi:hypothetical protein
VRHHHPTTTRGESDEPRTQMPCATFPSWVPWMAAPAPTDGMSQRGLALTTPALSYISHFLEAKASPW